MKTSPVKATSQKTKIADEKKPVVATSKPSTTLESLFNQIKN